MPMKSKKQLSSVSVHEMRVDVSAAVIKTKSVNWFISAWDSVRACPEIVINGFRKAGILEAITTVC